MVRGPGVAPESFFSVLCKCSEGLVLGQNEEVRDKLLIDTTILSTYD